METYDRGVCIAWEREALLSIKAGIVADPERILSSWRGQDCCRWKGVRCSSMTGHVIVLDLHGNEDEYLSGEISSSLIVLEHLQHLDLSYNLLTVPQGRLPDFIGSLHHLRYLNLSAMGFSGMVPHQLGNLSRTGTVRNQLGTLNPDDPASMYMGNPGLFGPPSKELLGKPHGRKQR
ncbi:hypothetical protein ZWY2020_017004 [Hordeum vulgare]|nr:hypothetical protein ZWY2020_017004 [Hordeum vulgare]